MQVRNLHYRERKKAKVAGVSKVQKPYQCYILMHQNPLRDAMCNATERRESNNNKHDRKKTIRNVKHHKPSIKTVG